MLVLGVTRAGDEPKGALTGVIYRDDSPADPDAGDTRTITAPTLPAWLTLVDNGTAAVTPSGGQTVRLYGTTYSSFFVGSNGSLMFGSSDVLSAESLANHFVRPRVSALFDDLNPASGGATPNRSQGGCRAAAARNNRWSGLRRRHPAAAAGRV